jgi:hypothetical protein
MATRESVQGVLGHLSVALANESFAPGETLSGVVKLSTLELIETRERGSSNCKVQHGGGHWLTCLFCTALAVVIEGREEVAWDEGGYSPVTNAFDKIILQHKVRLAIEPQVVGSIGLTTSPLQRVSLSCLRRRPSVPARRSIASSSSCPRT